MWELLELRYDISGMFSTSSFIPLLCASWWNPESCWRWHSRRFEWVSYENAIEWKSSLWEIIIMKEESSHTCKAHLIMYLGKLKSFYAGDYMYIHINAGNTFWKITSGTICIWTNKGINNNLKKNFCLMPNMYILETIQLNFNNNE